MKTSKIVVAACAVALGLMSSVVFYAMSYNDTSNGNMISHEKNLFEQSTTQPHTEPVTENKSVPANVNRRIDTSKVTKITCVGDSITYGKGVKEHRETQAFPAVLQSACEIQVDNFGLSGRALQKDSDKPYTAESKYTQSLNSGAELYIIMLGTNDSKPMNWNSERYEAELREFVKNYQSLRNNPQIVLMQPPKVFKELKPKTLLDDKVIRNEVYTIVERVGRELGCQVIDLYSFTEDRPEWFPDGIHPNAEGNFAIGEYIYSEIF